MGKLSCTEIAGEIPKGREDPPSPGYGETRRLDPPNSTVQSTKRFSIQGRGRSHAYSRKCGILRRRPSAHQ